MVSDVCGSDAALEEATNGFGFRDHVVVRLAPLGLAGGLDCGHVGFIDKLCECLVPEQETQSKFGVVWLGRVAAFVIPLGLH